MHGRPHFLTWAAAYIERILLKYLLTHWLRFWVRSQAETLIISLFTCWKTEHFISWWFWVKKVAILCSVLPSSEWSRLKNKVKESVNFLWRIPYSFACLETCSEESPPLLFFFLPVWKISHLRIRHQSVGQFEGSSSQ